MAEFKDSMQMRHWQLTGETIASRRARAHGAAVAAREGDAGGVLTAGDEARLRAFHERRILRFVQTMQLGDKVAATGITFFKRFFVDQSVMDFNPTAIALSAVYAALKVEETVLSADELVGRWDAVMHGVEAGVDLAAAPESRDRCCERVRASTVLNVELAFLQQLKFHLICYHPFRSLGMLGEVLRQKGVGGDGLADVLGRARYTVCRRALLSDIALSFPPAVIAVGGVLVAAEEAEEAGVAGVAGVRVEEVLGAIGAGGVAVAGGVRTWVEAVVRMMRGLADKEKEGEVAAVAEVEARRRRCARRSNFLTECLREEEEARDLGGVDAEEARRCLAAKEKAAALVGITPGDGRDGRDGRDGTETARKRQKV